ncbi:DUF3472 domain-containing protein [Rosenbergiella nectarea]|uniref:DUF3472 domain-containing protein n=1 Tax=Rosenbergiella nectarea TaxID=988801 RepID=UPI001F4E2BB9|nr:hypothetical protein [Rosenbergiella nectarea]
MMKRLSFGLLPLFITSLAFADPTIHYEAPNGHDYDGLSVKVKVEKMTKQKGYYWANTFIFYEGDHQGYMGIQPRETGSQNLAIFSVFGSGAKSSSPNCNRGADGGSGVSCRVQYEFVPGVNYQLSITQQPNSEAGFNLWRGTITDLDQGKTTTIGEYMTPTSWGKLWRKATFFDEWFPFNAGPKDPAKRDCVPYAKLLTWNPVFIRQGEQTVSSVKGSSITSGQDKCAVEQGAPNVRLTLGSDYHSVETGIFSPSAKQ